MSSTQRSRPDNGAALKKARLSQPLRLRLSTGQQRPILSSQRSLWPNKWSHLVVVTVRSTSPLESRRTACVTPFTATAEFACAGAVTPSFTCEQSIRSVPYR